MPVKFVNNSADFERAVVKKSIQFVNAIASVGANWSKIDAPIAYGTLVNSQQTSVRLNGTEVDAKVGFYTEYAIYLEEGENWKPKPPPKYGSKKKGITPAAAWNPKAKPHFLRNGFERPEAQAEMAKMVNIFKF